MSETAKVMDPRIGRASAACPSIGKYFFLNSRGDSCNRLAAIRGIRATVSEDVPVFHDCPLAFLRASIIYIFEDPKLIT